MHLPLIWWLRVRWLIVLNVPLFLCITGFKRVNTLNVPVRHLPLLEGVRGLLGKIYTLDKHRKWAITQTHDDYGIGCSITFVMSGYFLETLSRVKMTCPTVWLPTYTSRLGLSWKALIMPKMYPAEFRLRAVALVRAGGRRITQRRLWTWSQRCCVA